MLAVQNIKRAIYDAVLLLLSPCADEEAAACSFQIKRREKRSRKRRGVENYDNKKKLLQRKANISSMSIAYARAALGVSGS